MTTPAKPVKAKSVKDDASREAKRMAAILLDVLAGSRTPTQAAETLGVSLPRYYQLESRGLDVLLGGRANRVRAAVRRRPARRTRRCVGTTSGCVASCRQQSLVRLMQRTIGVAPPPPVKPTGKRNARRSVVRAMRRAEELRAEEITADGSTPAATPV